MQVTDPTTPHPAQQGSRALLESLAQSLRADDFVPVDEDSLTGADVFFYNECPPEDFTRFGGRVLFNVNVVRNANDFDERLVLERFAKRGLALSCTEAGAEGTHRAWGYVLAGASDAAAEQSFVREAVRYALGLAATPLIEALGSLRECGLLSEAALFETAHALISGENAAAAAGTRSTDSAS